MLGWHLLGSLAFAAAHIAGLWLLRTLVFGTLGQPYTFLGNPLTDLLYEYRKDLLPYAVVVLFLSLTRGIELAKREADMARREARDTGRLTLKSGGRTIFLDAASLDWASAAGNYVEIRANGVTHLVRIGLAALEQQLAEAKVPAVRVHRSRLVNRDKVREIMPTGDGDFRLRLADGSELRGSRRYRQALA
jgi:DNA-binding LytR/AlgR family response regulator